MVLRPPQGRSLAGKRYPARDDLCGFFGTIPGHHGLVDWFDVYDQIDAVNERPGQSLQIATHTGRITTARMMTIPEPSTRTRVGRRNKLDCCRQRHRPARTTDDDLTLLERLTQGIENAARHLEQLIQNDDAVVGSRELSGNRGPAATADQRGRASTVVRGSQRRCQRQWIVRAAVTGH